MRTSFIAFLLVNALCVYSAPYGFPPHPHGPIYPHHQGPPYPHPPGPPYPHPPGPPPGYHYHSMGDYHPANYHDHPANYHDHPANTYHDHPANIYHSNTYSPGPPHPVHQGFDQGSQASDHLAQQEPEHPIHRFLNSFGKNAR